MEKSAGLVILKNNKVLLCHPTNSGWVGTFSLPKGNNNTGEDNLTAAIRETKEEIGIDIPIDIIDKTEYIVNYSDKKGKHFKTVYYYIVNLNKHNFDIPDKIPKEQLQPEEVDWAGFIPIEEAKTKILWRFKNEPFLNNEL
jgi:predicted NUDIX family NTP pyrophosphohydrolase